MAKKPNIRFAGFEDDWEQRKLGKLGSLKNGMNFSKDAMGHGFPFVNLQNIFGSNVVNVNELGLADATEKQLLEYSLLEGDVLFVRSSVKLEGVGEAALVPENLENTTYSGFIIRFRDEYGLNNDFKQYIFGTPKVRNQIMAQATNSANKNISQGVLENLTFEVPSFYEQAKIGEYFSNIDHLITLHQRKCDELKKVKKIMLQKMFPKKGEKNPEIRFDGFTNDWEQRKLGEVCVRVTRKNKNNESDLPLTIASQYGLIDQRDFFNKVIAAKDMSNYYLLKKGEFAYNKSYSKGFDYGSIKRLNVYEQGCLSTLYICFSIETDEVDSDYLECFFDTLSWYHDVSAICAEGARNHGLLNVDVKAFFKDVNIEMPSQIQEQRKISVFINTIDHLITLHQRKSEELKNVKKYMLQNMFAKGE